MQNLFDTLKNILSEDKRFITEKGEILRNAVYEAGMKMDKSLLKMLLSNAATKEKFFQEVELDGNKTLVFDKVGFGWVVSNKEFLPDSYTCYKNKIGLVDGNDQYISNSNDVELVFPYKDCVLVGGQTKEDQKRNEIFFNKTLAPDEVDRLLAPKVLVNAKRYTKDGVEQITEFKDSDNLIIKGNNLLALESLQNFHCKVKMAYWDIPYNTGEDSFGYNDKFSRSSWLVFIKNRINALLLTLKDDGVILIQCSFHHYAYLKVLLDEIIGNHIMTFNVLVRHPDRILTGDKDFNDVMEYILVYSKNQSFKMPKIEINKTVDDYVYSLEELTEGHDIIIGDKKVKCYYPDEYILKKVEAGKDNFKIITVRGSIKEKNSSGRFYVKYLEKIQDEYPPMTVFKVPHMGDDIYDFRYFYTPPKGNKNGAYLQGMPTSSQITYKPYSNFLDFVKSYNAVNDEGEVEFRNGKKPEILIAFLLNIFTKENDIVIDAFLGSGTTASVALKMNRKFIGIEQMNYIENKTVKRLENTISGDHTGISRIEDWQGGGSFVYCELAQLNQKYVDALQEADTDEKVTDILKAVLATGFISDKVNLKLIDTEAEDYKALSLDEKKAFVMEVLDSNLLYVNYSDIDDKEFAISDADKAFTKSFYGEE